MSRTPRLIKFYRQHHRWFAASDTILQKVFQARGGGFFSQALVGMSVVKTVLDTAYPSDSVWAIIRAMGFYNKESSVGGALCNMLMNSPLEREIIASTTYAAVWYWPEAGVAAIYDHSNSFSEGPFLREGGEDQFSKILQDIVWSKGNDLMLVTKKVPTHQGYKGAGRFGTIPMHPMGRYVGKRQPKWYSERLQRYDQSLPRTFCFRGPTGVGKSVLARHVAREMRGPHARVLKLSSEVLKGCRADELLEFVHYLQPTVLLLDDLDLDDQDNTRSFLAILEILRSPGVLVIVTMMTNPGACAEEPKPGAWHFPGMRPDRIDEFFTLRLPNEDERFDILTLYRDGMDSKLSNKKLRKVAKATEGLTGAYLKEVLNRIHVHGWKSWKKEVKHVLYTAPVPSEEQEEQEGKTLSPGYPTTGCPPTNGK